MPISRNGSGKQSHVKPIKSFIKVITEKGILKIQNKCYKYHICSYKILPKQLSVCYYGISVMHISKIPLSKFAFTTSLIRIIGLRPLEADSFLEPFYILQAVNGAN
jgi:hypothetical protein